MFTKIKEFLFGKDPVQSPVAAPYKVEATAPKVVPASTKSSVAGPTPAELKAVAEIADAIHDTGKPVKAPAKPKATPKLKAVAKPKATPRPRTPKAPK